MLCPVFRYIVFYGFAGKHLRDAVFPVFIRGLGMLVVIIAFALFSVEDLNPKFLLSNAFS